MKYLKKPMGGYPSEGPYFYNNLLETVDVFITHRSIFINPWASLWLNAVYVTSTSAAVCYHCLYCLLCFVFRPHGLLPLLQAGVQREGFCQLQLHIPVHPPFLGLRRFQRLWGLRRRDQLPGWEPAKTLVIVVCLQESLLNCRRNHVFLFCFFWVDWSNI